MKVKLTHRLWAKITAIALLVIFCAVIAAAAVGAIVCFENNVYHSNGSFYQSAFCEQEVWSAAYEVESIVMGRGLENLQDRLDGLHYPSAWICVFDPVTEEILAETEMPVSLEDADYVRDSYYRGDNAYIDTMLFDLQGGFYGHDYPAYSEFTTDERIDGSESQGYAVKVAVAPALMEGDAFFEAAEYFRFFYEWRYAFWIIAGVAALLAIGCLTFLIFAAGHRKGTDEIVLNPIDRAPLDLLAAVYLGVFCFAVWAADHLNAFAMLLVFAGIGAPLLLSLILTFATRCKAGTLLKNTLVFLVGRWFIRGIRFLYGMLPLIGKAVAVLIGIAMAELVLLAAALNFGFGVILFIAFNLALLAAAFFGAWQMQLLKKAGRQLASGDLSHKLDTTRMYWEFRAHGESLNSIGSGMAAAVEQRLKSERLKTELITNVSHDIKTPLTSIINYVDLLQREETTEAERAEYLDILSRQTQRLKKLTEDLLEASKASTGNISVSLVPTDLSELVNQAAAEYSERLSAAGLKSVLSLPDEAVYASADGRLLWRVLDNLLSNACKYALPGTRIYLDVRESAEHAVLSVKNISREPLNVSPDELIERFVRGDAARASEGSGLGLSIAKSLTELQGGTFSLTVDGDLFKAEITLRR